MRAILVAILFGAGLLSPATGAASPVGPPPEAEATLRKLLSAFENLDYEAFVVLFAEDATLFFPTPEPPQRFEGRAAIGEHFRSVFNRIRQTSEVKSPPYQKLVPEELAWQVYSRDTAIAIFHLRNEERIARRTVVLVLRNGGWRVVHLHASNVPRH